MSKSVPYLRRAASGTWYVHWTENRIGKRVSTRTKDMADAKAFLGGWLLMDHSAAPEGDRTLDEVWAVYRKKHVGAKVANDYNADLAWKQMEPHFGGRTISGLTQDLIDAYVHKRTTGALGRKVKPQTVLKELTYLLAAVRFCADSRRKLIGPEFGLMKFDLPEHGEPRDRWLRTDELQRLFAAAAALRREEHEASVRNAKRQKWPAPTERLSRGERFLWLALETAARKEAILQLTWDRVDFETGMIVYDVPGRRRTKKRRVTVPMSKTLRPMLERAYAERLNPKDPRGLVLDNSAAIWTVIQRIAVKAGFGAPEKKKDEDVKPGAKPRATGISPHVLRHTAATHMARRGTSIFKIAWTLGNTVAMVEKVYAKHMPDDLKEAVNSISFGELEAAE